MNVRRTCNQPCWVVVAPVARLGWSALPWAALAMCAVLYGWLLVDVITRGMNHLCQGDSGASWWAIPGRFLAFLCAVPDDPTGQAGVGPMVVSTMGVLAVCLLTAAPLALGTAVVLSEYLGDSWQAKWLHWSLDAMAGVPSIVFGLAGQAVLCRALGWGYSIMAGGITLACMVLPLLIRVWEIGLRSVPREQRWAASSLGMSTARTALHVVLPQAGPSLVVGLILAIGRAVAESAALIYTSGMVARMPTSLWDSGRTLAVHIYDLAMHVPEGFNAAYATAVALMATVWLVNLAAVRLFQGRWTIACPIEPAPKDPYR